MMYLALLHCLQVILSKNSFLFFSFPRPLHTISFNLNYFLNNLRYDVLEFNFGEVNVILHTQEYVIRP